MLHEVSENTFPWIKQKFYALRLEAIQQPTTYLDVSQEVVIF